MASKKEKKKKMRAARVRRPKHPRVILTIEITTEVLLVVMVLWLTIGRVPPALVSAFIR